MTDDDDPGADATDAFTTYTVTVSGKAERLLRMVADAWELERPTSLGPLGQLPDIASEAFARGLVELAAESGLDVDRARLLPTDALVARRARERRDRARGVAPVPPRPPRRDEPARGV